MPRIKRSSTPVDQFDEDFDDDSCSSKNGNPPIQRNAANARERARMRVLSSAFGRLKTKLPNIPPDTKLSKLDTLRLATIYIKQLKTLVEGSTINSENAEAKIHITDIKTLNFQQCSQSMTWPFAFQHIHTAGRQLALQFPNANWESTGGDLERKNQKNDTSNLSIEQINESAANLFQNKCNINADASNVNNCLFDCLHQQQQQQQLSYYIHRNHYDYNEPDYTDQHQDMQIH